MPPPRRVALMLDLDWPYKRHAGVFVGARKYAAEQCWVTLIDEYVADTLGDPKQSHPYDGVIARATRKVALRAARRGVPVVNVWFTSPAFRLVPGVFTDFAAVGRLRAEHLLSRGLRRFAALINENDRSQQMELKAFTTALAEAGCPCLTTRIPISPGQSLKEWRKAEQTIIAWMKAWQPPLGLFVGADMEGRIVTQMCCNRGWRVPEDVAIIAGRNEEALCEHSRPTLTSVEFNFERIGFEAARLLGRLMDGETPPAGPVWLPPQALIVRESTDFFAVDDPLIAAALAFIAANSHRPIGPNEVADAVATGRRTLSRHFEKHLERPIAAEIRRVRMERAKRELAQSERSIGDIARDAGFGNAMQMYKVFVREVGLTPSAYRCQRRSEREK